MENKMFSKKVAVLFGVVTAVSLLSACSTKEPEPVKPIGMANPASVFCTEQGGKLVMEKDTEGNSIGYCQLSDGTSVEQWAYFRENQK
jgi:uncharacterized protein